jgi:cytoskeletal protein RodZ
MRKMLTATTIGLVLALGAWLALVGTASAKNNAPKVHQHAATVRVFHATHGSSHATHAKAAHHAATRTASSSASSGDPSSESDSSDSSGESSTESSSSSETDTHQDPNGQDVNHECPPNCDTANGEQP